jgi:hypothetical protein
MTRIDALISQAQKDHSVHLDLSYLGITELPTEIGSLTDLSELDLRGNILESLPIEITHLDQLTRLYLDDNMFRKLPAAVCDLTGLKVLGLSNNRLDNLPPEIGNMTSVIRIDLKNNHLGRLPKEFGDIRELNVIDISSNEFSRLPTVLWKLRELVYLAASRNEIESVPANIGNLINLRYLNLADNNISDISPKFGRLRNLRYLDLSSNRLSELPARLFRLPTLTSLDISDNLFDEIPESLADLDTLAWLDISGHESAHPPSRILDLVEAGLRIGIHSDLDTEQHPISFLKWALQFRQDALLATHTEDRPYISSLIAGTVDLMRFWVVDMADSSNWILEEQEYGLTGHGHAGYVLLFSGGTLGRNQFDNFLNEFQFLPIDEDMDPFARILVPRDDCVFSYACDIAQIWMLYRFDYITVTRADGEVLSDRNLKDIEQQISSDIYQDFDEEDDDELRLEFTASVDKKLLSVYFNPMY